MIKVKIVLFLMSVLVLGCSVEGTDDFGSYYQKQASLEPLKMPPGVTAEKMDNYYIVPPGPMADVKTVSILPPGSRAFNSALKKAPPQPTVAPQETQPVEATVSDTTEKPSNDH